MATVSMTVCDVAPGVVDGEKEAVGPAGDTVAVNEMGFVYVRLDGEGATVRLNVAVWPAFTVLEEVCEVTM